MAQSRRLGLIDGGACQAVSIYGLEWDAQELEFTLDGVLVRRGPNTHWHHSLTLNLDSETLPDRFGLPQDSDMPSTFSIDLVRARKKGGDAVGAS